MFTRRMDDGNAEGSVSWRVEAVVDAVHQVSCALVEIVGQEGWIVQLRQEKDACACGAVEELADEALRCVPSAPGRAEFDYNEGRVCGCGAGGRCRCSWSHGW